jgi:hypothetical protein
MSAVGTMNMVVSRIDKLLANVTASNPRNLSQKVQTLLSCRGMERLEKQYYGQIRYSGEV